MDGPVGFLRFGEGTLAICGPGSSRIVKFQWEFEGSEAGIMKNLRKMKVLGGVAGRRRESPQGGETARPGSNIVENVRFGAPGPFCGPWRPMLPLGQAFWTLLAWSWDPKMRAGNLLAQPTGPVSRGQISILEMWVACANGLLYSIK